jgi:hypothetical protein
MLQETPCVCFVNFAKHVCNIFGERLKHNVCITFDMSMRNATYLGGAPIVVDMCCLDCLDCSCKLVRLCCFGIPSFVCVTSIVDHTAFACTCVY